MDVCVPIQAKPRSMYRLTFFFKLINLPPNLNLSTDNSKNQATDQQEQLRS